MDQSIKEILKGGGGENSPYIGFLKKKWVVVSISQDVKCFSLTYTYTAQIYKLEGLQPTLIWNVVEGDLLYYYCYF